MSGKWFSRFVILLFLLPSIMRGEDGSRLWLRYEKLGESQMSQLADMSLVYDPKLPTVEIAADELKRAWGGFFGKQFSNAANNSIVIGTAADKKIIALIPKKDFTGLGDGFLIRTITRGERRYLVVAAEKPEGVLYGTFALLRMIQRGQPTDNIDIREVPSYKIRILNHWDNLDGTIERGYAGHSIWKWDELPAVVSPRYVDYARANASIGINATVLNNVNASPKILSAEYLAKAKVIADVLRPYGIKVFLAINFSSPAELGGLPNSDPLDPKVQRWWSEKAKEIYKTIPDFGGFLVKANSEGLPGPQDYGRTHSQGANMLADALKPFGGLVMWRAFVYNPSSDDRAKQAYNEFVPLDGQFRDNVIVQIKNGPIDFQPREPFSPLFGAMPKTAIMPEFQITQEYTGFSNHLVYLAPMFKETLDSDTYRDGEGSTVAKITTSPKNSAIAGVANIGEDTNWTGHHFAQANWYSFGRLAWNPELDPSDIAYEWLGMSFNTDPEFVDMATDMMFTSREAVVNYMMPMGLHHIFAWGHHYGPEPWCNVEGARPDWLPPYYHRADSTGLGFDRTMSGSGAVAQYHSPLREKFDDPATTPIEYLLWFHHVPWDYEMSNGATMWSELCFHYQFGVKQTRDMQRMWDFLEKYIDHERFAEVQSKLKIQSRDAVWWRDACLLYFQTFSKRPFPILLERPIYELEDLKKIKLNMTHHN